jgi:GNAT superfamily N-acetyltransferase
MALPVLREMVRADIDAVVDLFARNDWGDRRSAMEFNVRQPQIRPFVADADGDVVATGVVCLNGPVGWVGTVFVDPAWRRHGLGTEITRRTLETADEAGCRTLVLIATDAGRPMYERLGFEVQTWNRILEAPGLPVTTQVDARIRPFAADDLPAMLVLDAEATGEDRAHLLEAFASQTTAKVIDRGDGTLGAFIVRAPWGGGATIAPRIEDACAMLEARRIAQGADGRVRAGLMAENEAGIETLLAAGWADAWRAPRLVRGEPMTWHPEAIWGQFNHALG